MWQRRDPEYYHDEGCTLARSCLDCPFTRCRYDDPTQSFGIIATRRNNHIRQLKAQGTSVSELSASFSMSRRQIWRILGEKARG